MSSALLKGEEHVRKPGAARRHCRVCSASGALARTIGPFQMMVFEDAIAALKGVLEEKTNTLGDIISHHISMVTMSYSQMLTAIDCIYHLRYVCQEMNADKCFVRLRKSMRM